MATYDASDIKVEFDPTEGGSLQDITASVVSLNGFKVNAAMDDTTPFGVSWSAPGYGGLKTVDDINLTVVYDDTATTGMKALFVGCEGQTRTYKETWGSTNTTSVETIIASVEKVPAKGQKTRLNVVLHPTGTVTEA